MAVKGEAGSGVGFHERRGECEHLPLDLYVVIGKSVVALLCLIACSADRRYGH